MRTLIARRRSAALLATLALVLAPALAEAKTVKGTKGNDHLHGTSRADKISGWDGKDTIDGEGGNDTILGGAGSDVVDGGSGNDSLQTGGPASSRQPDNDVVHGGAGNDVLRTGTGNDKLYGQAGNDELNADVGNDYLDGGDGVDVLEGFDGNDQLYGQEGNDWLHGLDGNDHVDGGPGNDHVQGGEGNDRVYGGGGRDEIDGDEGDDFIDGGSGPSSCPDLVGTASTNNCKIKQTGPAAHKGPGYITPNITADEGDDVIYPGLGIDIAFGEEGFDTFVMTDDGVYDRIFCSDGESEPNPPAPGLRGRVIYVSTSGRDIDAHDDIRNCDPGKVSTMTPAQFMNDDSLVYPGTHQHLPLPAGIK